MEQVTLESQTKQMGIAEQQAHLHAKRAQGMALATLLLTSLIGSYPQHPYRFLCVGALGSAFVYKEWDKERGFLREHVLLTDWFVLYGTLSSETINSRLDKLKGKPQQQWGITLWAKRIWQRDTVVPQDVQTAFAAQSGESYEREEGKRVVALRESLKKPVPQISVLPKPKEHAVHIDMAGLKTDYEEPPPQQHWLWSWLPERRPFSSFQEESFPV